MWLVDFSELINAYQCFFMLNILFDEVDRRLGHQKKYLFDTIFIIFS